MDRLELFKKLTIQALVSEETFLEKLVLKGGNALNLAYNISDRGSIDVDFSMADDFTAEEKQNLNDNAEKMLNESFNPKDFQVFDVKFIEKPKKISDNVKDFWGGYMIEFKIISIYEYNRLNGNINKIRTQAIAVKEDNSTRYTVDISRFEYVEGAKYKEIDGSVLQVYTPEMIVLEKLRAICQQSKEYNKIIGSMTSKSRARDFYDIHNILESFKIDFTTKEIHELAICIFEAKRVPLAFIGNMEQDRERHRLSWEAVTLTINQEIKLKDFDYYFDFVNDNFKHLFN